MSNLERDPQESLCGGTVAVAATPTRDLLLARDVPLGRTTIVRRLLPQRDRRMVGAWCFLDHYAEDIAGRPGMQVPPHPHTGLQTVSWLLEGEILHRDSLGSEQMVRPGELNLMTAGRAIAHSEESPPQHPPGLHGVQLWVALPDAARQGDPGFDHHPRLPVLEDRGLSVTVLLGELAGGLSPAKAFSPLVGADVVLEAGADVRLPLERDFEYAVVVLTGSASVEGVDLATDQMLYLGCGRSDLALSAAAPVRLLLIGGEPFEEELVMWWNFIGRSHDEIAEAREDWMRGRRFGTVTGYDGDPLPAPPLPATRLKPRGRQG